MSYSEALRIRAEATAALKVQGIDAVVTADGREVTPNLIDGADVVLITPPATTRTGTALEVTTWTVYGICSQADDVTVYWPRLDELTAALEDPLEVESFKFVTWGTNQGNEYPAIEYTFTT